jgi:hypothetical protein
VPFPQRLLVDGLVRVRSVGDLLELVGRIFVIGDTGIASLVTLLLAVAVPRESGRLWAELEQRAKSDRLSEEELIALLDALKFNVMERKIRACRRFKVDAFVSDAARQAAAALSRSSLKTGGLKAANSAALREHQAVFIAQFEALYASSMAAVLRGGSHAKWAAKQKRRAADVAAVVRAVADFRLQQWLLQQNAAPDAAALHDAVQALFRPATKFDDGVLVLIGKVTFNSSRRGFAPTSAKDFVKALARTFTVIELSEFNTSKLDWSCGAKMVLDSATSFRFWSCPHGGHRQNKDVVACLSMLRIGLLLLTTGKKPALWCTPRQILAAQEQPDAERSNTGAGGRNRNTRRSTTVGGSGSAAAANTQEALDGNDNAADTQKAIDGNDNAVSADDAADKAIAAGVLASLAGNTTGL